VAVPSHIARWDLDKTYLRTEFDTLRDLVKTALERADEKRTNPGASTLLREMVRAGVSVHILSGSPEQMRKRLEDKLRLDGITWDSFTLKPNLQNMLRLRFRALKDQLGYKLPALLRARTKSADDAALEGLGLKETLFGDDAEADAFVYSLYGDICAGKVGEDALVAICEKGKVYEDVLEEIVSDVRRLQPREIVERVLIHLEGQTPPDDFRIYGARVVPFYNYLQAAFVVYEDGRLPAEAVLRVATELVVQHRFDGDALARSYLDLGRRGHLRGTGETVAALGTALASWTDREKVPGASELQRMCEKLAAHAEVARKSSRLGEPAPMPDYAKLVGAHNPRKKKR
jgi:hypothetical protein